MSTLFVNMLQMTEYLLQACRQAGKIAIITDENVKEHYADTLMLSLQSPEVNPHLIVIPPGESSKSRQMKAQIEDQLFALRFGRDSLLIALGGGVVTDLTGFVAATFCRGIPVIYLPTTLLAMVDAAIGGKTGINLSQGKNLLGTFTQPLMTLIDLSHLMTLPEREYRGAFAEIIKHALIVDAAHFSAIEQQVDDLLQKDLSKLEPIVCRSVEIKQQMVLQDQTEQGVRACLNYGHTIAHALEHLSNYQLSHGQAVAWGLLIEAQLSVDLGYLDCITVTRLQVLLQKFHMLPKLSKSITSEKVYDQLKYDKKSREASVRFVLLSSLGATVCEDGSYLITVEKTKVMRVLDRYFQCEI